MITIYETIYAVLLPLLLWILTYFLHHDDSIETLHGDVTKCKHFLRYWTFVCAGNSPVAGEFPAQRPVTRSFDVFFHFRLNKRLSKPSRRRWFKTPSLSSSRYCNNEATGSPHKRPVTRSFVVVFNVSFCKPLNKQLSFRYLRRHDAHVTSL